MTIRLQWQSRYCLCDGAGWQHHTDGARGGGQARTSRVGSAFPFLARSGVRLLVLAVVRGFEAFLHLPFGLTVSVGLLVLAGLPVLWTSRLLTGLPVLIGLLVPMDFSRP